MNVKKGDTVKIMAGKDKGKEGVVLSVLRAEEKAVVDGYNVFKKHVKDRQKDKGGIVEYSAPIHVSNLKVTKKAPSKTTKK